MQIRDCVALTMLASCVLAASPMASDYPTEGNDPGRTGWMKDEGCRQTAVPAMEQVSPGRYTIYAISWDGRLHQINAAETAATEQTRSAGLLNPEPRTLNRTEPEPGTEPGTQEPGTLEPVSDASLRRADRRVDRYRAEDPRQLPGSNLH